MFQAFPNDPPFLRLAFEETQSQEITPAVGLHLILRFNKTLTVSEGGSLAFTLWLW